jgi:hypothetical protein
MGLMLMNSPKSNKRPRLESENSVTTSTLIYETAKEALWQRIKVLQSVYDNEEGWRNAVMGRDSATTIAPARYF